MIPKSIKPRLSMTVSSKFKQIDINQMIIDGNLVEINFRGLLNEAITNNEIILSDLPRPFSDKVVLIGISSNQYRLDTIKWGYVDGSGRIRGEGFESRKWMHISWSYIKA